MQWSREPQGVTELLSLSSFRIIISSMISVAIYSGILLPSAVRDFVAILWMSS